MWYSTLTFGWMRSYTADAFRSNSRSFFFSLKKFYTIYFDHIFPSSILPDSPAPCYQLYIFISLKQTSKTRSTHTTQNIKWTSRPIWQKYVNRAKWDRVDSGFLQSPILHFLHFQLQLYIFIQHVELKVHVPYFVHWKVLMRKPKSMEMLTWPLPCTLKMFYVHSDSGTIPTPDVELTSMFIGIWNLCSSKL